jgi:hypothetical protein
VRCLIWWPELAEYAAMGGGRIGFVSVHGCYMPFEISSWYRTWLVSTVYARAREVS